MNYYNYNADNIEKKNDNVESRKNLLSILLSPIEYHYIILECHWDMEILLLEIV